MYISEEAGWHYKKQYGPRTENLLNQIILALGPGNIKKNPFGHSIVHHIENHTEFIGGFLCDYVANELGLGAIYMLAIGLTKMASHGFIYIKCNDFKNKGIITDSANIKEDVAALKLKHGLSCFNEQRYKDAELYLQEAYNIRKQLFSLSDSRTNQVKMHLQKCREKMDQITKPQFNQSVYKELQKHTGKNSLTPSLGPHHMMHGYSNQDIVNQQNVVLRTINTYCAENNRAVLDVCHSIASYSNWQMASFMNRIFKENIEQHIHKRAIGQAYNKLKKLIYR